MPHFLRVKNIGLHVPSISHVITDTSCLGRGYLRIYYHNSRKPTVLSYAKQDEWWADYKLIREAMAEVDKLLSSLPLAESTTSPAVITAADTAAVAAPALVAVQPLSNEIVVEVEPTTS
jgi:hypothetical protein